jgi:hypothetical protein
MNRKSRLIRSKPNSWLENLEIRQQLASSSNQNGELIQPSCFSCGAGGHGYCGNFQKSAVAELGGPGAQEFQIGGRWSNTATNGSVVGSSGNPITLTWGLVNDGLNIPGFNGEPASGSSLRAALNARYPGGQAVWLPLFQQVFDRWGQITGITYVYQASDDGAGFGSAAGQLGVRADIRIGGHSIDGGSNILAYNFFPNNGDMVIDTDDLASGGFMANTASNSLRLRNVLSHEHGHGLGFNHVDPINNTKLMEAFASVAFDGPQFDDTLAGQRNYGDPLERGGRNETLGTATNLGNIATGNVTLASNVSIANNNDVDWFRFSVADPRNINITLDPFGPTYNQGPQNGGTSSFNGSAQSNLGFEVRDIGGNIIVTQNSQGLGLDEVFNNLTLNTGTYFIRVTGDASGNTQMYNLTVNSAAASAVPDLQALSDTGASATDNIVRLNNSTPGSVLTFDIFSTTAGATVELLYNNVVIGSAIAAGTSTTVTTNGSLTLPDGVVQIQARQIIGGNPQSGGFINLTVDTAAPTVSALIYDRELTQDITFTLSEANPNLTAAAFDLQNTSTSTPRAIDNVFIVGNNVTLQFATVLDNGNYAFNFTSLAADVAGNTIANPSTLTFRHLGGDANNDGIVDFSDLLVLSQNFGQPNRTYSQGNFDYTTSVSFPDLLILSQNFGNSLIQASPALKARAATPVSSGRRRVADAVIA